MALSIAVSSIDANAVTLAISDRSGSGVSQIQVQYAPRKDFLWCVAPMPRLTPANSITLSELNQASRNFFRARELAADGDPGPWSNVVAAYVPAQTSRDVAPARIMNEPAIIVVPEPVLSWYCSSEETGYPARALGRNDLQSQLWARQAQGGFAIEATLTGGPVDVVALLETNIPEGASITIKADDTTDGLRGSAPAFVYGPVAFRASAGLEERRGYHGFWRLPEVRYHRLWRIEVTGTLPGNLLAATFAIFGKARRTACFAVDSKTETASDGGSINRDRSSNPTVVSGYRGRVVEFEIAQITEAQYEVEYDQLRWLAGLSDPVMVVPNAKPGAFIHDRILLGQFTRLRANNHYTPRFTLGVAVDSLI